MASLLPTGCSSLYSWREIHDYYLTTPFGRQIVIALLHDLHKLLANLKPGRLARSMRSICLHTKSWTLLLQPLGARRYREHLPDSLPPSANLHARGSCCLVTGTTVGMDSQRAREPIESPFHAFSNGNAQGKARKAPAPRGLERPVHDSHRFVVSGSDDYIGGLRV